MIREMVTTWVLTLAFASAAFGMHWALAKEAQRNTITIEAAK